MEKCPRCKSENIKKVDYMGSSMIICLSCGYDERDSYDVYPEQKTSQKAKKEFNPYKQGGYFRTMK